MNGALKYAKCIIESKGGLAHLVERLLCKQRVRSSNLLTSKLKHKHKMSEKVLKKVMSPKDFIEHKITLDQYNLIEEYEKHLRREIGNRNTLFTDEKDDAKLKGAAVEVILSLYENMVFGDGQDCDLYYKGWGVEVKGQGCNSKPSIDFEVWMKKSQSIITPAKLLVAARVLNRKNENERLHTAWICGIIPMEEFISIADYIPKGTMKNYGPVKIDKIETPYKNLYAPKQFFRARLA